MNNMNLDKSNLARNLLSLRKCNSLSQEKVAEIIGVTRQAVAKWEMGESTPDIINCNALATLYEVTLDDLVRFDQEKEGISVPPKGKHLFGTVQIGERGQIVIPKKARDVLGLKQGDEFAILGDTDPDSGGIALMRVETFMRMANIPIGKIFGKEDDR